jgi:hypothetical protein
MEKTIIQPVGQSPKNLGRPDHGTGKTDLKVMGSQPGDDPPGRRAAAFALI